MAAQSGRAWAAHWEGQDQTWLDKNSYGVAVALALLLMLLLQLLILLLILLLLMQMVRVNVLLLRSPSSLQGI